MKRALLIGIDYLAIPSITLKGCVYDVINVRDVLTDAYDYDSITILRDDINNAATMPTRANIINNLTDIVNKSTSLDEIWIHYSGHGSQIPNKNSYTNNGLDNILVPCDFQTNGFITDKDLLAIVKNIKCKALLLFDACHSGTMCDLEWSFQYNSPISWSKIQNNKVGTIANPNICIISGCKDEQTSADAFIKADETSQGAFTNAFINGLRNYRHNVSVNQLYQYVCGYLKSNGFNQVPVLSATESTPKYNFARTISAPTVTAPTFAASKTTVTSNMRNLLQSR
uniref:Peptidase C14 caspase domain-containing protein n=1 Tax=viral metagenome TaxID=1070528 RepID=A0A6C0B8B0_9ZZZZ